MSNIDSLTGQTSGLPVIELPATYTLLGRLKTVLGPGGLDVVLGDGLYFNAPFFNLCLEELHSDVLVKTDDARRDVIVDAMGLFQTPPGLFDGLVRAEGTDVERLCTYQMVMAPGLPWRACRSRCGSSGFVRSI